MAIEAEQLGVPDTAYKCSISMPSSEFQRIVRDLQVMGDTCKISCTKEGLKFSATGQIGTGNILMRQNVASEKEEDHVTIDMEEPVELNFALRYLNFFTKATPLSPTVILKMSPGLPIVIEYPIEQLGHVKYYLAPKMEEDEEE
jgi:proliferating cell nuclear antigen